MSRQSAAAKPGTASIDRPGEKRWLEHLLSPHLTGLVVLALVIAVTPFFLGNPYHYDLAISVGINAIVVIGLNLLIGYAGQISLGHAAFFGIGAYASAILTGTYGWPGLLALITGVLVAGLAALIIARPILRLSGHYLAMATLGFGMIIYLVISKEVTWTGGPDGMVVPPLEIFGYTIASLEVWYWIIGAMLVFVFWLALNLIDSPIGRALHAIHGSEIAASTAGVDVTRYKVLIFVISALLAALMGGVYAFYAGFIAPNSANFMHSIVFAVMVVFGGMASVVGAVVGATVLTVLPQYLAVFAEYELLAYGVILMLVMIFMPKGLVPTLHDWIRRWLG